MTAVSKQANKWLAVILLAAFVFITSLLAGCGEQQPQMMQHSGITMGTTFTVKWVGKNENTAELQQQINKRLIEINQVMSTYIEDSELSKLNREPAGFSAVISKELADLITVSLQISENSAGAFDMTVGPLVNLWGFGPDGRVINAPDQQQIAEIRQRVGYAYISVDQQSSRLTKLRASYIDLSAIAKGYGVDQIAELLQQYGINDYLVEIGGELRASGNKPGKQPWRIAVETPTADLDRTVQRIIAVNNTAIATSGDYRNYFEEDGIRFSHTIDPASGKPITHRLASVSVLMPDCAHADAYATALMVMGPERGVRFAEEQGISAFFIINTDQGFVERMTGRFNSYLVE